MEKVDHEAVRLQLQDDLDSQKTQSERNRLGQFATPTRLAAEVVSSGLALLPLRSIVRFLDPAFGTGSFFSALQLELPAARLAAASGFEIDPHYGDHAKRIWNATALNLQIADFTRLDSPSNDREKFNFLVCNPPYVRHHHLSQEQKSYLKSAVEHRNGLTMSGLSGLYCYFMALSRAWMTQDGIAAWLIPSEFMDVNYGIHLKQFLLEQVSLLRIHRFDTNDVQFDDALVSSAVVFFQNRKPDGNHSASFTFGGTLASPKLRCDVTAHQLRDISKWTALPQNIRLQSEATGNLTLSDLFSIKRGLATGGNSFFVLTKDEADRHDIPAQFLTPILPSPRYLDSDEIVGDLNGNPKISRQLFLINCSLQDEEVERDHPKLWAYLQTGVETGISAGYLCSHRVPWYSQENRPAAPFLCTYMGRSSAKSAAPFRFILNRSKATAANVYLMLYPKPILASILNNKPEAMQTVWKALCTITTDMMTGEGRLYGGGLHKIEPKELGRVSADLVLREIGHGVKVERQARFVM